ncbi:TonB-dependent receptor domain-containing protein [Flavihumibacter stibioxidans]|uniref:Outer membrane protein beta-barrel domain-containing protein n=1 Tax=Flavihumibacter stibioxidans TaxID=1834163 RepID=A0ABR7MA44_9BACT|nr:TonB-dependent receptor [Flavihumibacter stibioxidans]MBC6491699.1 hypothetical protein [Flavihumibacter stibioxidans]
MSLMLRVILVAILFVFSMSVKSQSGKRLRLSGVVKEKQNLKAIANASIVVYAKSSGEIIGGSMTDERGAFKLSAKQDSVYKVVVSAVGFSQYVDTVFGEIRDIVIYLDQDIKALQGVTISSSAKTSYSVDKNTFTINERDARLAPKAIELLRIVPQLFVSNDNTISINGKKNIIVFLDGKPITSNHVLSTIPSEMIKKVEVISNPSAKYEGEVIEGVVNIVTKENWKGSYGSFTGSLALPNYKNLSGSYSMKRKKLSLTINGGYNYYKRTGYKSEIWNDATMNDEQFNQQREGTNSAHNPFANLSFKYDLDSTSRLTYSSGVTLPSYYNGLSTEYSRVKAGNTVPGSEYKLYSDNESSSRIIMNYIDYSRKMKNRGELSFALQTNNRTNRVDIYTTKLSGAPQVQYLNKNKSHFDEYSFQAGMVHPAGQKLRLEYGIKYLLRDYNAMNEYFSYDSTTNGYVPSGNLSTQPNLDGNTRLLSGYYLMHVPLTKIYIIQPGVRAEYTRDNIYFQNIASKTVYRSYANLLPSITLSRRIKSGIIRLVYSRRFKRPGIYYLDPFRDNRDPLNIRIGNPNLLPEKSDHFSFSVSGPFKKVNNWDLSIFSTKRSDLIQAVFEGLGGDTTITTFVNLGKGLDYGLTSSLSIASVKKIRLSSNIQVTHSGLKNQELSNSGWIVSGDFTVFCSLPKKIVASASYSFRSGGVLLQGITPAESSTQFTLSKRLFNNRLHFSLNMNDFLYDNSIRRAAIMVKGYRQTFKNYLDLRSYGISITFNFGKATNRYIGQKKINNDDLLDN